tara:strand:- start:27217 stop:27381 length:165 start_codon:yes stop_codon:yes gene_type:complete
MKTYEKIKLDIMKRQVKNIAKKKMLTANLEEYVKFLSVVALKGNDSMNNKLSHG